ncbi:MAG TPA: ComEC/Rec2 family competence protein [Verrucomicrobiae bacterium]|nr:ComEC/Rec2 family competence protein [Verrucomicrobiae bacterium]
MKRPFLVVVSFYIAGLLIADFFHPPVIALFIASFSLVALVFALKKYRPFLVLALLTLVGWTNLAIHQAVVSPNDLRRLVGDQTELVSIRGALARMPQIKIVARNNAEHSLTQIRVTGISGGDNWQPAFGTIIVSTPSPLANFFTGQSVEISGLIARPATPIAEGLFDYRDYLATRGIFYELRAASTNNWKTLQPVLSTPPLTDRFLNWSKRTLSVGLSEDETLHLLWAMTLGWRTAFTGDIGDPFLRAGTMHLFAIDGLRIALLSGMIVALLRVFRLSRAWCGAIAIPAIWFYTAATGWESSAVRASVMMTVVLGGWALKRPWDLVNSLAAAAFLILLWEPRQLFEASFQLSFFVMLTIGLLLPKLNQFTDTHLRFDPLVPEQLIPKWRRVLMRAARILARYFSLSLAAWLGSIPLSALYFHLFSPISPLANLIAVPLGTFAIMANLGALICGAWLPFLTGLFNNAAWFFMSAMTWVSNEFTRIPGSYFYVRSPSWISIGIFYVVLFVSLSGWLKTRTRQVIGAAALIVVAGIYLCRWETSRAETVITVLPLDGGQSVFVNAGAQKENWLIDCGNADAVNFTLKDFLRGQAVDKIPRLALTEGESRNCGGAVALAQLFGVGELWTSPAHFRSAVYNGIVSEFEKSASSSRKTFDFGGQYGCWQVLWPPPTANFSRANDAALVLLGHFPAARILFLSDLGRLGQNGLLVTTNNLRADIVVAGLPNEGEPLSDPLIAAIHPKLIVIVDSDSVFARHVTPRLKDRLADQNVPVIYTRASGAAKIILDKTGWKLQTLDGHQFTSAPLSN